MTEHQLELFWSKVVKTEGCWLWQGSLARGYGRVRIDAVMYSAHRLAWMLSNGPVPVGLVIMHKCDVRNCVRPEHLQLGTQSENMKDAYRKGRLQAPGAGFRTSGGRWPRVSGEHHYNAKIPDSEIPVIRARAAAGDKFAAIARDYGVTSQNIYLIVKYKSRAGVKQKETEELEKITL